LGIYSTSTPLSHIQQYTVKSLDRASSHSGGSDGIPYSARGLCSPSLGSYVPPPPRSGGPQHGVPMASVGAGVVVRGSKDIVMPAPGPGPVARLPIALCASRRQADEVCRRGNTFPLGGHIFTPSAGPRGQYGNASRKPSLAREPGSVSTSHPSPWVPSARSWGCPPVPRNLEPNSTGEPGVGRVWGPLSGEELMRSGTGTPRPPGGRGHFHPAPVIQ